MNLELTGHVALVTGGASGVGRACVNALVAEGASVVILDRSTAGADVAREWQLAGADVSFIQADVTAEDEVRAAVARVVEERGRLDTVFPIRGERPVRLLSGRALVVCAAWEPKTAQVIRSVAPGGGTAVALISKPGRPQRPRRWCPQHPSMPRSSFALGEFDGRGGWAPGIPCRGPAFVPCACSAEWRNRTVALPSLSKGRVPDPRSGAPGRESRVRDHRGSRPTRAGPPVISSWMSSSRSSTAMAVPAGRTRDAGRHRFVETVTVNFAFRAT
ncbi:SDR family NAD(P)-dependent oxidoreductase [Microbacterium sp. I2]|uniref:SDR family NAD(P)-dependent oxidoreductase n=1 Tax=Microbacterium sp. I2 TaxID=3391826 RepID=UPI003ED917E9